MNYYKKSCILRQIKAGFSGDGKPLTGLIKVEKYGQNLAVEISIINFSPLSKGEYYCILCDSRYRVEKLPLRGKCYFNLISDLSLEEGFCGVVCFIHDEVTPIACGINGDRRYDFSKMLATAFRAEKDAQKRPIIHKIEQNEPPMGEDTTKSPEKVEVPSESAFSHVYDDEMVACENYYEKEGVYEPRVSKEGDEDVPTKSGIQEKTQGAKKDATKDDDAQDVRHPFAVDGHGYYDAVREEIDALFSAHPRDDTLKGIFASSEWARVKGEDGDPQYLVGVVYEEFLPKYICYAIAAKEEAPPKEIAEACIFVPVSAFEGGRGFFVIFQSAATGECIRPTAS